MHWNKLTLSVIALGLFLALFFALFLPLRPSGQILDQGWVADFKGVRTANVSIPYIQPSSEAGEILTLTITLTDIHGDSIIFRPGGYAFVVISGAHCNISSKNMWALG